MASASPFGMQQNGGCFGMRSPWQHPSLFPLCYGIPTARAGSCCTAPTCLLWWHEARWVVGVQGGLLHRGNPLWKCRGREAVVLAGVCVKLEQGVLVGSVPCRETTCGKVLGSPTQAATHSVPREQAGLTCGHPGRGQRAKVTGGDVTVLQQLLQNRELYGVSRS